MTRYVLGALIAIAVIGGLGYVVYSRSFGDAAPTKPESTAVLTPASAPHDPDIVPLPASTVVKITGRVEKRAGAQWVELQVGDRLTALDTIRTAADASATLDIGALVEVDDLTELTVGEISASLAQVVLTEGRVTATTTGSTTIRISTRDTDAVAESGRGRFDVLSSGRGQVTVAATEGDVKVTAKYTTVVVPAGKLSMVAAGGAPTAPSTIPTSLFLKVNAAAQARDRAELRGETTPGAVVSINGVRAAADERGMFTGDVPLRTGANTIIVSVEDATGRRQQKVIQRHVAVVRPPRLEAQVQWK